LSPIKKYQLKQTLKTRFLNLFRRIFTLPAFEKIVVDLTLNSSSWFLRKVIPPDYLYKKGSFRNVTRQGINYHLDISTVIDHGIYFGYKEPTNDFITQKLKSSKTILDVGANVGSTALYYASLNPTARILAFEPHPDNYKKAAENIRLNHFQNIELVNMGCGEKKETVKLYEVNKNNPGMNRIIAAEQNFPYKTIEVDLLDNIASEKKIAKADLIKIDVEGFEYSVLLGAKELIQKSKPTLFIELDDNNLKENNRRARELIELLISFGYKEIFRADNLKPLTIHSDFTNCHYDIVAV
jgi:FkbM family methyltransferase